MKLYDIEISEKDYYGSPKYRFVSLYNGTRGTWFYERKAAVKQGENHQDIIEILYEV